MLGIDRIKYYTWPGYHIGKLQHSAQDSQEVSAFQVGGQKAARNTEDSITNTNIKYR